MKKEGDREIIKKLGIDEKTLSKFKEVQRSAIAEAKAFGLRKNKKIKVLGISGSARDENDTAQEKSNSEELLKVCLEECKKMGADIELIPLRKYRIEHCKACYSTTNTQCHFYCTCYPKGKSGDDMTNILYDKVLGADIILFATPVNNFSMSTLMKGFIDRCISLDGSLKPADPKDPKNKELNKKHMEFVKLAYDQNVPGSGMFKRFTGKIGGIITSGHEEGATMVISSLFMTLNHYGIMFPPFSNTYAMSSVCNSTHEDKRIVTSECNKSWVKLLAKNVMHLSHLVRKDNPNNWIYEYDEN